MRYVKSRLTGNAAADNTYNIADMASFLEAVRNVGANNVVILGAWRTRAPIRWSRPMERQREIYRFANAGVDTASRKALASLCQMLLSSKRIPLRGPGPLW